MNHLEEATSTLKQLEKEDDALDQSMALNKITMHLLKTRAQECKRLWIALIISILVNLLTVGAFLWYESQWEQTTTTTTQVEQDSGEQGNNMLQIGGNNAHLSLDPEEVEADGQAVSENHSNQDTQP